MFRYMMIVEIIDFSPTRSDRYLTFANELYIFLLLKALSQGKQNYFLKSLLLVNIFCQVICSFYAFF